MTGDVRIRLGTDLITFFDLERWGLAPTTSYQEWVRIVQANPRKYFDAMLDDCVEAGIQGVEFAPPPGGLDTALMAYGSTSALAAALSSRDLVVSSSFTFGAPLILGVLDGGSNRTSVDDEMKRHAETLVELGADLIVIGSVPRSEIGDRSVNAEVSRDLISKIADQIDLLGAAAAAGGARLALHTDAYSVCSRADDIEQILANTSPENVKLCLDAGHVTLDGGDAVDTLRRHVDRVPIMHWKDCIGPLDGDSLTGAVMERHATMLTYFRILGSGKVDWQEWQRILAAESWSGWAIAEIDMSPDPVAEIRAALEYFQRELAPVHA